MMSVLPEYTFNGEMDNSGGSVPVDDVSEDSDIFLRLPPILEKGDHPDSNSGIPVPSKLVHGEVERERKLQLHFQE